MSRWRDRDGTLYERDENEAADHHCHDGQEDGHGRVIVCRTCRPALAARLDRQRSDQAAARPR